MTAREYCQHFCPCDTYCEPDCWLECTKRDPTKVEGNAKAMAPHNALRTIENKIRDLKSYVGEQDPVWVALDSLWDYVISGAPK